MQALASSFMGYTTVPEARETRVDHARRVKWLVREHSVPLGSGVNKVTLPLKPPTRGSGVSEDG